MVTVIVTYKVKPDKVEENESFIRAVFEELKLKDAAEVKYASFKKEDNQTFVHIASFPSEEKQKILTESESFRKFQENLKERCEIPPNVEKLDKVDSINFL